MIFHADSESDLKTTPNHVKKHILSKIRFLWYFDLKFPLRYGLLRPWEAPGPSPGPLCVCKLAQLAELAERHRPEAGHTIGDPSQIPGGTIFFLVFWGLLGNVL